MAKAAAKTAKTAKTAKGAKAGKKIGTIAEDALSALRRYRFPGNVRELANAIERAVLLADGDRLEMEHFAELIADPMTSPGDRRPVDAGLKVLLREFERNQIRDALARAGGNRADAARTLDISYRWLLQRIQDLDLR